MNDIPEDKSIELSTDYQNYILSAAFFSYCAAQGLSKEEVSDMVSTYYDEFLNNEE